MMRTTCSPGKGISAIEGQTGMLGCLGALLHMTHRLSCLLLAISTPDVSVPHQKLVQLTLWVNCIQVPVAANRSQASFQYMLPLTHYALDVDGPEVIDVLKRIDDWGITRFHQVALKMK